MLSSTDESKGPSVASAGTGRNRLNAGVGIDGTGAGVGGGGGGVAGLQIARGVGYTPDGKTIAVSTVRNDLAQGDASFDDDGDESSRLRHQVAAESRRQAEEAAAAMAVDDAEAGGRGGRGRGRGRPERRGRGDDPAATSAHARKGHESSGVLSSFDMANMAVSAMVAGDPRSDPSMLGESELFYGVGERGGDVGIVSFLVTSSSVT